MYSGGTESAILLRSKLERENCIREDRRTLDGREAGDRSARDVEEELRTFVDSSLRLRSQSGAVRDREDPLQTSLEGLLYILREFMGAEIEPATCISCFYHSHHTYSYPFITVHRTERRSYKCTPFCPHDFLPRKGSK